MAIKTTIGWCDSTLNLQMGCNGCELWNRKTDVSHCYAGTLTDRYAGQKGWPDSFEEPKLFTERLDKTLRWSDLTGTNRPDKPWLNGLPRMIFLNDMGDTFTEGLPIDWLAPLLPRLTESPHVYMLLTKRAKRMREFADNNPLPDNVWPGVSITSQATAGRVADLVAIQSGGRKWISAEPLLGPLDLRRQLPGWKWCNGCGRLLKMPRVGHPKCNCGHQDRSRLSGFGSRGLFPIEHLDLVISGGESGTDARECFVDWHRDLRDQCQNSGVAFFLKQLGTRVVDRVNNTDESRFWPAGTKVAAWTGHPGLWAISLSDRKGETLSEFPSDLRLRAFPQPLLSI